MRCAICKHGTTEPGIGPVALTRGDTTIVLQGVPMNVCDNCGEQYFSEEVSITLLGNLDQAIQNSVRIEVRSFTAA